MAEDFSVLADGLAPGDQVASYQIQEQIGRGGMAVVYRALDLRLDRQVALKVLAPHLGSDDAFRQRFIRESHAAATVDHPHIIPVFEAGEADDVLFIAMRYVSFGDVRALIETQGRLSAARTASITAQVASALDAAHGHGLVHRDVKPGNMLLGAIGGSGTDHVYLSDFGLSKHSLAATTLTAAGQFMGTLDYVSPEQIQGQPADGRADQYALACAAVEMLTGAPPFRQGKSMALLWAKLEEPPPPIRERRPELPAAIDTVLGTALARSPADRYPSCMAFAAALRAACEVRPVTTQPATQHREATPLAQAPPAASRALAAAAPFPSPAPATPAAAAQVAAQDLATSARGRPGPAPTAYDSPAAHDGPAAHDSPTGAAAAAIAAGPDRGAPATTRPVPPRGAPARDTRAMREDHLVPQRHTAPRSRGRGRTTTLSLLGVIVLAGLAAAGYKLLDSPARRPQPVTTVTVTPGTPASSPEQVVEAYFAAINARNYQEAWNLVGRKGPSYQEFAAGFAGTAHDTVTIESTNGSVVTARLAAAQTNGQVKYYQGTYTVTGGIISSSDVQPAGG